MSSRRLVLENKFAVQTAKSSIERRSRGTPCLFCISVQYENQDIARKERFFSKDFNRPEWKKLITVIKKNRQRPSENKLFLKWDRFSRNIAFAYQMIDILSVLNVQAKAIDQPVDF